MSLRRFLRRFRPANLTPRAARRPLSLVALENRLAPAAVPVGYDPATPIDTVRPLTVQRNPADGNEVTHFKLTNLFNGTLFEDAALAKPVNIGDFVSLSDGAGGVFSSATFYFQPTTGFVGTASVEIQAAEDAAGKGLSPSFVSFIGVVAADVPTVPANAGLTPDLSALSNGATTYDFVVQYKDAVGLDLTKLGDGDVFVRNRAGTFTQAAKFLGASTANAPFATYRITAPGGDWDATDNGDYVVNLAANELFNTAGTAAPRQDVAGFTVDLTPPAATAFHISAANLPPVTDADAGSKSYSYTLTYVDGTAVAVLTFDNSNTAVIGPNGVYYGNDFFQVDDKTDGTPRNASYVFGTPDAGGWGKADAGRYTIVSTGTAKNVAGELVPAGVVGTFDVTIGAPAGPTAQFTATAKTQDEGNAADVIITVELSAPAAQDTFVQIAFSGKATLNDPLVNPADFDYTVDQFAVPPFTVQIAAGQTTGTMKIQINDDKLVEQTEDAVFTIDPASAGIVVGAKNAFTLSITDNDTPVGGNPTAAIGTAPAVDAAFANQTKYEFEVVYTATGANLIDAASIDDGNVKITGPNGFSQDAVFVSSTPFPGNQSPLTVVYRFTPPGGTWDKSDNGDYAITVVGNQVKDSAGNFVAAGALKTVTATLTNDPQAGATGPVVLGYAGFGIGADAGGGGKVSVRVGSFGAQTEVFAIQPFSGFTGGVRTAVADFNGDGFNDLLVGTGPGASTQIKIVDGADQSKTLFELAPFETAFKGGVYVAAGDLTGDGTPDLVITPDEGGGPRCRVFNGKTFTQIADFFGIDDPNFRGGARAALSDISGDGRADLLVAAGFGGGPRVALYDGSKLASTGGPKFLGDFFVFEQTLRNGVFLAAGDVTGDGFADLVVGGGPGGGPRVFALSGKALATTGDKTQVANFFAGDPNSRGGVRVTLKDLDGDDRSDIVVGAGAGTGSKVIGYLGKNVAANGTPAEAFSFDTFAGFTGGVYVG